MKLLQINHFGIFLSNKKYNGIKSAAELWKEKPKILSNRYGKNLRFCKYGNESKNRSMALMFLRRLNSISRPLKATKKIRGKIIDLQ